MTRRNISMIDTLSALVEYHYVDYTVTSVRSFFQDKFNLSEPEAQVVLNILESHHFMAQGSGQSWITEEGRNELERLTEEIKW